MTNINPTDPSGYLRIKSKGDETDQTPQGVLWEEKVSDPTTDTEEVHEDKVVIQVTRIVHWKRFENDWIWTTNVQSHTVLCLL